MLTTKIYKYYMLMYTGLDISNKHFYSSPALSLLYFRKTVDHISRLLVNNTH